MIDQGAQMEAHDCHYGTPLHVACAREHFECAKVLLSAGEIVISLVFVYSSVLGSAYQATGVLLIDQTDLCHLCFTFQKGQM